jgi:hypothetical protein
VCVCVSVCVCARARLHGGGNLVFGKAIRVDACDDDCPAALLPSAHSSSAHFQGGHVWSSSPKGTMSPADTPPSGPVHVRMGVCVCLCQCCIAGMHVCTPSSKLVLLEHTHEHAHAHTHQH